MNINLDNELLFTIGSLRINKTIFYTWIIIGIIMFLTFILRLVLTSKKEIGKMQAFFEILITTIQGQIEKTGDFNIKQVFPFIATLFLFILISNLISIVPFFVSPTASLSTIVALVISVVLFSFIYGIYNKGLKFFQKYLKPSSVMLPMNIIGDVSSSFSLSLRLYGNIMSSMVISMVISKIIFLSLGLPIFLNLLGMISGVIQAYIFTVLALMFIG